MGLSFCSDLNANRTYGRYPPAKLPYKSWEWNYAMEPNPIDLKSKLSSTGESTLAPHQSKAFSAQYRAMALGSTGDQRMLKARDCLNSYNIMNSFDNSKPRSKSRKIRSSHGSIEYSPSRLQNISMSSPEEIETSSPEASTKFQI